MCIDWLCHFSLFFSHLSCEIRLENIYMKILFSQKVSPKKYSLQYTYVYTKLGFWNEFLMKIAIFVYSSFAVFCNMSTIHFHNFHTKTKIPVS